MPAPKKDASTRRRTNKATTAATLTDGTSVIRPDLPTRYDEDGLETTWKPETLAWWDDLWAAPMAREYHSSDKHALFLLAVLMDQFWTHPDQKLAGEIRLQRQAFGLTPYDRRRLEWTIETAEEAQDRGVARRTRSAPPQPAAATDPRLALVK